jgi:MYXO-CTERM domain-containing protein
MSVTTNECIAEVNRDCLIACQINNFEDCKTNTVQTCNTTCQNKGGAIFCDGQFINASDLQACADQLATEFSFNIDVNVNADVNGTVSTVTKDSKTTTTAKCSFGAPPRNSNGILAAALGAVAIVVARRRRRS